MGSNTFSDDEEVERVVAVTEKGQATIPKEFREQLGIETPGKVKFRRTASGEIVVEAIRSIRSFRGAIDASEGPSGTEILREERARDEERTEEKYARFLDQ